MKNEIKRARVKKIYKDTVGVRAALGGAGMITLYVLGGVAYAAGKKALSDIALIGIGAISIGLIVYGLIVNKIIMKK